MTKNQLEYWRNEETKRANRATESEEKRHNLAMEGHNARSLIESGRHNRVTEAETGRSNRANEYLKSQSNTIALNQLGENRRHNMATETNDLLKIEQQRYATDEQRRHNQQSEKIDSVRNDINREYNRDTIRLGNKQADEAKRHNQTSEWITGIHAAGDITNDLFGNIIKYQSGSLLQGGRQNGTNSIQKQIQRSIQKQSGQKRLPGPSNQLPGARN